MYMYIRMYMYNMYAFYIVSQTRIVLRKSKGVFFPEVIKYTVRTMMGSDMYYKVLFSKKPLKTRWVTYNSCFSNVKSCSLSYNVVLKYLDTHEYVDTYCIRLHWL